MNAQGGSKHRAYIEEIGDSLGVSVQKGLDFIGWERLVSRNSRVFVKPNFTAPRYQEGVTTNPQLLRCLLEALKSKADRVIVGESDGGYHSFRAEEAFQAHDMYRICKETGAELVNLSTLPRRTVRSRVLSKTVEVELPRLLLEEVDCFVSVPVLKVHVMTTVSLSIKNLWGCVPDTMRLLHHNPMSHKLALIAQLLKPRIVVIDGTYGLNEHGPMDGVPVKTNLLIASDNPVAADALGAAVMGFSPQKVEHIRVAAELGLGSADLGHVETNRDWQQLRRQFRVRRNFEDTLSILPFHSHALAKIIFDSSFTPWIYRALRVARSSERAPAARNT